MKTVIYSKAVQNEINAINEQQTSVNKVSKINYEFIGALLTLGAIMALFLVLNSMGLVREF